MKITLFSLSTALTIACLLFVSACKKDDPDTPNPKSPEVTTTSITEICSRSATLAGSVVGMGKGAVTDRGVCWSSTNSSPTTSDSKNSNGSDLGAFTASLTGLLPNTTYYARAYATNSFGTGYGEVKKFSTLDTPKTFTATVNGVSFTMVGVEGGTFSMGSDIENYETIHPATVIDFYMGETEVTQALYKAVMGTNPSWFSPCDQCPVENLDWYAATSFIAGLNQLTGKTYRLPTEAEWEYAAGGGSGSRTKYAGTGVESTLGNYAWYYGNNNNKTHPVKSKSPNALGLYDMSGNVWEWCQDWYDYYPTSSSAGYSGPATGSLRIIRGGGWYDTPVDCRVANRHGYLPALRFNGLGFRLALSL